MKRFYCKEEECEAHLNQVEFSWPEVKTKNNLKGPIHKFLNGTQILCPVCEKPLAIKKK